MHKGIRGVGLYRGEISREHRALCSGEKNGRAAAVEKSGGEAPRAWKRGKLGCVWSPNRHEKNGRAAAREKLWHEAPRKKTAALRLGKKSGREAG